MRYERLAPHHAALVFADLQDADIFRYIPGAPPVSIAALEAHYRHLASGGSHSERWYNWLAFDGDTPVGTLQATFYVHTRLAEVAWIIFSKYWRRGYGAVASQWMLDQLIAMGALEAEVTIDPRNAASQALARRLGFLHAGEREGDLLFARPLTAT